jgi:hypothetical protein
VFDDHHKSYRLTSLPSWSFLRCIKFIYINSKSTVRNTVDYSGQEKLFGNSPLRGPSGPLQRTVRDTRVTLGQEHCKTSIYATNCPKEKWAPFRTKLGPSGLRRGSSDHWKNQENPKVTGSVKFIFNVLADRLGYTAEPSMTALSDIWRCIKCTIAVDLAVTADRCDFSRWCAGAWCRCFGSDRTPGVVPQGVLWVGRCRQL